MPILEKGCISSYLGLIGPYLVPIGPYLIPIASYLVPIGSYLVPIGPYLVPIGPYLIPIGPYLALLGPIWPYWALFGPIGPYLALTVKQKRDTEGSDRGHRTSVVQQEKFLEIDGDGQFSGVLGAPGNLNSHSLQTKRSLAWDL